MKTLIFIQNLKQTLMDVGNGVQNHLFFVNPDYKLLQDLKKHSLLKLGSEVNGNSEFVQDLLSRDIFLSRLRYCIVKLREFGIDESKYFDYISNAINKVIDNENFYPHEHMGIDYKCSVNSLLEIELAKCFKIWYRPDDLYSYDFAQERQLILPDPKEKNWTVSNLGNYFIQLSSFEAIVFLCSLEVVLTLEHHKNKFVSINTLDELIASYNDNHKINRFSYPYSLRLFGLIKGYYDEEREMSVTDFGYRVLLSVRDKLPEYQNTIMFLLESEATGFRVHTEINFENFLKIVEDCNILILDQKKSIKKAVELYSTGSYLDSLRIIYPILEGTLDSALRSIKLNPSEFRGMRSKIEKLEKELIISSKMSTALEIFSSRNKVLHGNILEEDVESVKPLFSLVLVFLKRLVVELEEKVKIA